MNTIPLPIANGFYVSDALPISNQQCVNLKPNIPQADTVTDANLFNTEGLRELIDLSNLSDTCRGLHVMAGIPYCVIGQKLYRINRTFVDSEPQYSSDDLGTIEGQSRVWMADNGTQLCVVAVPDDITAGKSYIFTNDPDTLTQIIDADFDGPAGSVVYTDGFFVFHKHGDKKFFNSAINDGLAYDALDFTQADADQGNIEGLAVNQDQLYVLSKNTVKLYRNIGRSPAPFQAIPGAHDIGVTAPQSITKFAGNIAFVGSAVNESPSVWLVNGPTKTKLSTTAIDNELSKLTDTEAQALSTFVYGESGSFFIGITTPITTYVYDLTTQRWHERQSVSGETMTKYRASHAVTAYGLLMVGDNQGGKIGALDECCFTEYGVLVRRFITTKPFDNMGGDVRASRIEMVVENGVGLTADVDVIAGYFENTPQMVTGGADPQITLSWSDDGGRNFKGYLSRSMGKIGEFKVRPTWRRMGRITRSRVLRFEVSSPTKVTLIKAEAIVK